MHQSPGAGSRYPGCRITELQGIEGRSQPGPTDQVADDAPAGIGEHERAMRNSAELEGGGAMGAENSWNWPPSMDAVVAAPDIGALGYLSQRRVVDLAGLVTPQMVPILERLTPEDAVARFSFATFSRPAYVVDRAATAWDLEQRSPYARALTRLGHAALPNLGIARPAPAVYSFYRIDWAVYDSLSRGR